MQAVIERGWRSVAYAYRVYVAGMPRHELALICAAAAAFAGSSAVLRAAPDPDPFLWLEERNGAKALEWVAEQNRHTDAQLGGDARFAAYRDALLAEGSDRHSDVEIQAGEGWVHRVVQGTGHPRGVWQRVRFEGYAGKPDIEWESVLDLDALAAREGRDWYFWNGSWGIQCPDEASETCLVSLSDQGSDDTRVVREYDLRQRRFVAQGFAIPASRPWVEWMDRNTVLISPDLGPGTLTPGVGGQPFTVRLWRRGETLARAPEIWRGTPADTGGAQLQRFVDELGKPHLFIRQQHARWSRSHWLVSSGEKPARLELPLDASLYGVHRDELVFAIDTDWDSPAGRFRGGSLLSAPLAQMSRRSFPVRVLSERTERESDYYPIMATRKGIVTVSYLEMRPRIWLFTLDDGKWKRAVLLESGEDALRPQLADPVSPILLVAREGFVKPVEWLRIDTSNGNASTFEKPQHAPDAKSYVVERAMAPSADGTRVPYSIVRRRDVAYDGTAPTFIHAYGGSQGSQWPTFSAEREVLWLRKGGIFVVANVRGGAEFGPAWHRAAIRTHKQRTVDDVIGVAEELIRRRVTSPRRLGVEGESNGGMVMGAVLVQRPDLIHAAVLEVPDLDLVRHTVLNGSQEHIEEIGSPDIPEERTALQRLSPYENLRAANGFPVPYVVSSTVDEIVHPAHSRKFIAKMASLGLPALYLEMPTGGHHHNFTPQLWARFQAYKYLYLAQRLMDEPAR